MLGDWHLALASYNWGEGAVGARDREEPGRGPADRLPQPDMPAETRYYVPKLQALKNIVAEPGALRHRARPDSQPALFRHRHADAATSTCALAATARRHAASTNSSRSIPAHNRPVIHRGSRRRWCCRPTRPKCSAPTSKNTTSRWCRWQTYTLKQRRQAREHRRTLRHHRWRSCKQVNGIAPHANRRRHALLVPVKGDAAHEPLPAMFQPPRAADPHGRRTRSSAATPWRASRSRPASRRRSCSGRRPRSPASAASTIVDQHQVAAAERRPASSPPKISAPASAEARAASTPAQRQAGARPVTPQPASRQ